MKDTEKYTEDTIVVSANQEKDNVQDMHFNQNCWYAVEIDEKRLKPIRHIRHFALYEGDPKFAITYIADVDNVIPLDQQQLKASGRTIKPEVIQSINTKKIVKIHYRVRDLSLVYLSFYFILFVVYIDKSWMR